MYPTIYRYSMFASRISEGKFHLLLIEVNDQSE